MSKSKRPLCCVVNPRSLKCVTCKEQVCVAHSIECTDCNVKCFDCTVPKKCENCEKDVCHDCIRTVQHGDDEQRVCGDCYYDLTEPYYSCPCCSELPPDY